METIELRQLVAITYDCQSVMEVDKDWYDKFVTRQTEILGTPPRPLDIWNAAETKGFEPDIEWTEPSDDDTIVDTWIGE